MTPSLRLYMGAPLSLSQSFGQFALPRVTQAATEGGWVVVVKAFSLVCLQVDASTSESARQNQQSLLPAWAQ